MEQEKDIVNKLREGVPMEWRKPGMSLRWDAADEIEQLRSALKKAIRMVEEEYCSHGATVNADGTPTIFEHGAHNPTCYARELYAALGQERGNKTIIPSQLPNKIGTSEL